MRASSELVRLRGPSAITSASAFMSASRLLWAVIDHAEPMA